MPAAFAPAADGTANRIPGFKPWVEFIQPVERVGTLTLYYLPPGTLKQLPK